MSGPEVGDAAVQGPEEIADAFVWPRDRFALDLIEIALHGEAGKLGPPSPKALCGPLQTLVQRSGEPDGNLGFHMSHLVFVDAMQCTANASHTQERAGSFPVPTLRLRGVLRVRSCLVHPGDHTSVAC